MPYCDRPKPVEKISDPKSIGDCLTIEETASLLERQLVHSVYEEIAGHFSDTRHKPWPRVAQFIQSLPPDELLLDLGCGNGKMAPACRESGSVASFLKLRSAADEGAVGR